MPTIEEQIETIVSLREARRPKLVAEKEHLHKIHATLDQVDGLLSLINNEPENGPYHVMMAENPKMSQLICSISTRALRDKMKSLDRHLDTLIKRFGRKTIRIATIGEERMGKSTFLKTISGLPSDKIIPAYDGDSCTGAVSVIHNVDGEFRVDIEFYTMKEFLDIVERKLKKFFGRDIRVGNIEDLSKIDLSGFSSKNQKLNEEFSAFKKAYCQHVEEYRTYIDHERMSLTDENEVVKYVAQYERSETRQDGFYEKEIRDDNNQPMTVYQHDWYRYIAVKHVDIYKRFENIDSRRIELVDTIGLGDTSDLDAIEKKMFDVLRYDCDTAIDIYRPESLSETIKQSQIDILDKIVANLDQRNPKKWIVYVINKVEQGKGNNAAHVQSILEKYNSIDRPTAWAKIINGSSQDDVRENLIIPLLDLITKNLGELDDAMLQEARELSDTVYGLLFKLCEEMRHVISSGGIRNANEGKIFDMKYEEMIRNLYLALGELDDEKYRRKRNQPRPEVDKRLEEIINNLYDDLPEKDAIRREVMLYAQTDSNTFEKACHLLRNKIFDHFESVTDDVITPLRNKVKSEMRQVLFDAGMMGKVPLREVVKDEGASENWLDQLIEQKITAGQYPHLYAVLDYIRTYNFNIEDTIEYYVNASLSMIDPIDITGEYTPYTKNVTGSIDERCQSIMQEVFNRIPALKEKLTNNVKTFALIPSQSFATRIQKFHFRLTQNEEVKSDMKEFYRDNRYSIWADDFNRIEDQQQAFGKWNDLCNELSQLCQKEKFTL